MASIVLTDAFLSLTAINLSTYLKSVTLSYSAELIDDSAMGDTTRSRIAGVKDWSLDLEFKQDYAAGAVDATLFALVGVSAAVILRPASAVGSIGNPQYSGNGLIESYTPLGGAFGEMVMTSTTMQGNGILTRAVA